MTLREGADTMQQSRSAFILGAGEQARKGYWQAMLWPLLLAPALPPWGVPVLGWVAFAPVLVALYRQPEGGWRWSLGGWAGGALHYGLHCAWLPHVLALGGFGWERQALTVGVVAALLGSSWGAVFGLAWLLQRGLCGWRVPVLAAFPALLALHEMALLWLPWNGTPWGALSSSQWQSWLGGWSAPLGGAPGVALLLGLANAAWAGLWLWQAPHGAAGGPAPRGAGGLFAPPGVAQGGLRGLAAAASSGACAAVASRRGLLLLALGALCVLGAWPRQPGAAERLPGSASRQEAPASGHQAQEAGRRASEARPVAAAPAQGASSAPGGRPPAEGVGQPGAGFWAVLVGPRLELAAAPAQTAARLRFLMAQTLDGFLPPRAPGPAETGGRPQAPVLAIWPESAAGGRAEQGRRLVDVAAFGRALDADILLGSDSLRQGRLYNSALLVQHTPFEILRYDKRVLVPFGEYTPSGWAWLLGRKVTAGSRDYSSGQQAPLLYWRGYRLGLAICLEGISPLHVRRSVLGGAQVLVLLSNHLWLPPWAREQHLALAAMRALEAGRPALLATNGGISAWVRRGLPLRRGRPPSGRQAAVLRVWVAGAAGRTPWVRWGLLPALLGCGLLCCLGLRRKRL